MTALQQALIHLVLVIVAVVSIVVLQVTGNLTTVAAGFVLAVTGFGSVGVAGVTITPPVLTTVPATPPVVAAAVTGPAT